MNAPQCLWDAKATLGEGPIWIEDQQALLWVDIKQSMLHRYIPASTEKQTWHLPGGISSVAPTHQGGLIATFANGVFLLDPEMHQQQLIADAEPFRSANRANDGCCDTRGNFWFGTMDNAEKAATGAFYCLDNQGVCTQVLDGIVITNGPSFSADGETIYFTDTLAGKIFRARIEGTCNLTELETFITINKNSGYPDGMCTDLDGFLWVAHFAGSRITRFSPTGEIDQVIPMPVPNITKCVFGGENMDTLFITTANKGLSDRELKQFPLAGGLFSLKVNAVGFNYPPYNGPLTALKSKPHTQHIE